MPGARFLSPNTVRRGVARSNEPMACLGRSGADRIVTACVQNMALSRASRFGSISLAVTCAPWSGAEVLPPAPAQASRTRSPGCAPPAGEQLQYHVVQTPRLDGTALSLAGRARSSRTCVGLLGLDLIATALARSRV